MLLPAIGSTYKLLTPQKLECYRPRMQPSQVRGFAVSEAPNPQVSLSGGQRRKISL